MALNNYFLCCSPLVAAALPARDRAAVVPFNRCSFHVAALSWADSDATCADANCGVGVVPPATVPIIAVVAVPPDLNIDALGHLDALGLGRSDERGNRQRRCGCRHSKSDLHHVGVLLGLDLEAQRARTLRVPPEQSREDGGGAAKLIFRNSLAMMEVKSRRSKLVRRRPILGAVLLQLVGAYLMIAVLKRSGLGRYAPSLRREPH